MDIAIVEALAITLCKTYEAMLMLDDAHGIGVMAVSYTHLDVYKRQDLGLCPICQKGHIMKGSLGYACNYFKNMNDKCTFNIYHSPFTGRKRWRQRNSIKPCSNAG